MIHIYQDWLLRYVRLRVQLLHHIALLSWYVTCHISCHCAFCLKRAIWNQSFTTVPDFLFPKPSLEHFAPANAQHLFWKKVRWVKLFLVENNSEILWLKILCTSGCKSWIVLLITEVNRSKVRFCHQPMLSADQITWLHRNCVAVSGSKAPVAPKHQWQLMSGCGTSLEVPGMRSFCRGNPMTLKNSGIILHHWICMAIGCMGQY